MVAAAEQKQEPPEALERLTLDVLDEGVPNLSSIES